MASYEIIEGKKVLKDATITVHHTEDDAKTIAKARKLTEKKPIEKKKSSEGASRKKPATSSTVKTESTGAK